MHTYDKAHPKNEKKRPIELTILIIELSKKHVHLKNQEKFLEKFCQQITSRNEQTHPVHEYFFSGFFEKMDDYQKNDSF